MREQRIHDTPFVRAGLKPAPKDGRDAMQRVAQSLSDLIECYIRLIDLDNEVRDLFGYIAVSNPEKKHICNESREVVVRKFITEYVNYVTELTDTLERIRSSFGLNDPHRDR